LKQQEFLNTSGQTALAHTGQLLDQQFYSTKDTKVDGKTGKFFSFRYLTKDNKVFFLNICHSIVGWFLIS
jgi:hypothetical protein